MVPTSAAPVSSLNSWPTSATKSLGMSHAASSVGIDQRPPHPLGGVRVDGFVFDGEGVAHGFSSRWRAETIEAALPEPVEGVHPLPHLVEALGMQVVATLTTVALLAHESDPAQHREMLRDRGPAHRHDGGELVDGLVAAGEGGDEGATHGVGDGAEGVGDGGSAGRGHADTIRKENLTCQARAEGSRARSERNYQILRY